MAEDLFDVVHDDEAGDGIELRVITEPGPGRALVAERQHGALRIRLAMPPHSERANATCIELVAEMFAVPIEKVSIEKGMRERDKRLRVIGISPDAARSAIDRAIAEGSAQRGARRPN